MLLRISPFRAAASLHRQTRLSFLFFHSTPTRHDDIDDKTHYEILQVQTNAHLKDIKKSFYALSKAHHPDHNQHDPAASRRFMRLSEAYGVLSDTDRRAKYDRDVLRLHDQRAHQHRNRGSYSSTGPAGGRPASGLSRRRGTFHGPPPSFYRNGGWGTHGAKRSQAHEETAGSGGQHQARQQQQRQQQQQQGGDRTSMGGDGPGNSGRGMGPGQDPLGKGDAAAGDIPHFDREARAAHTRTQARNDERRARRMAREYHFPGAAGDWGESGSFFAVLGVLGVAIVVPYFVIGSWNMATATATAKKKKTREE